MEIFLTALHVMVCVVLVVVVLIQHGKGADIGAVFGGGASNTVFGSRGAGNFLTKLTTGAAILFMLTSLSLSYLANTRANRSLFEGIEGESAAPAGEAPGGFEEVTPTAPGGETSAGPGGFEEVSPPPAGATPSEDPGDAAGDPAQNRASGPPGAGGATTPSD